VPRLGTATDVRAELGLGEGPVIGSVGSLRPEKATGVLIRAAALLLPRLPDLQVLIAGDGDSRSLERLAGELGIADHVHLLGHRSDIAAINATLDVAVNTSDREGSSLSIMEYMEAGLPVVATRVGGTPDLVLDGVTGLLVPPRAPEPLAAAVARLLDDPALAAQMGAQARTRRRKHFTLDRMAKQVEALYEELLKLKA
jgi:glycosyltransferase involved in cell wall biosynthesis